MSRTMSTILLTVGLLGLWGCANLTTPTADPKLAAQLAKMVYPKDAPLGPDLDILVLIDGRNLTLVNRTPRSYAHMWLWLNQQWVGQAAQIAIGTDNHLDLSRFINAHGEMYPFGTFLHPDRAFPVVLAELYDPAQNVRYRLLAHRTGL